MNILFFADENIKRIIILLHHRATYCCSPATFQAQQLRTDRRVRELRRCCCRRCKSQHSDAIPLLLCKAAHSDGMQSK